MKNTERETNCDRKMKISQYCYRFCPMCMTMIYQIGLQNKIKLLLKTDIICRAQRETEAIVLQVLAAWWPGV